MSCQLADSLQKWFGCVRKVQQPSEEMAILCARRECIIESSIWQLCSIFNKEL